jgi:hypothetical protein
MVFLVELDFLLRSLSSADDSSHVVLTLGVDHDHEARRDWSNRDVPILFFRMLFIVDFKEAFCARKKLGNFLE